MLFRSLVGKWKGMYKLNLRGYVLAVIGRALVVAGYMGSVPLMMAFTALAALGQGPWQGDMNAVIASCSEYTYLTQGKRIDGSQRYMNCIISSADCGWVAFVPTYPLNSSIHPTTAVPIPPPIFTPREVQDRKSTRLNSSHQ